MDTDIQEQSKVPLGRRRDPHINPIVMEAALRLYAREGWAGFTFEAVAREAGVGKPALYRRWQSAEHLLVSAFEELRLPKAKDCGSLRADLEDYSMQFVRWYSNQEQANIGARLAVDRKMSAGIAEMYDHIVYNPRVEAARQISQRAKKRGELHSQNDTLMAIELVLGAMSWRWQFTPEDRIPKLITTFPAYVGEILDIVLAGVAAHVAGDAEA